MDQSRKQRVVGAVVLLVAAVVILPVLFDGQGSYELPLESRIPVPEPFPEIPRAVQERPVIAADSGQLGFAPDAVPADSGSPLQDPGGTVADQNRALAALSTDPATVTSAVTALVADPVVPPPVLDGDGLPEGWSVRLASFSSEANARALVERLQARGHRAYTREITSSQGPLVAVFVGPGVDRAAMLALQRQLQEEFQLAGMVVRYEIEAL